VIGIMLHNKVSMTVAYILSLQKSYELVNFEYDRGFFSSSFTIQLKPVLHHSDDARFYESQNHLHISNTIQHGPIIFQSGPRFAFGSVKTKIHQPLINSLFWRFYGSTTPYEISSIFEFNNDVITVIDIFPSLDIRYSKPLSLGRIQAVIHANASRSHFSSYLLAKRIQVTLAPYPVVLDLNDLRLELSSNERYSQMMIGQMQLNLAEALFHNKEYVLALFKDLKWEQNLRHKSGLLAGELSLNINETHIPLSDYSTGKLQLNLSFDKFDGSLKSIISLLKLGEQSPYTAAHKQTPSFSVKDSFITLEKGQATIESQLKIDSSNNLALYTTLTVNRQDFMELANLFGLLPVAQSMKQNQVLGDSQNTHQIELKYVLGQLLIKGKQGWLSLTKPANSDAAAK
jgi:hypothetical protein